MLRPGEKKMSIRRFRNTLALTVLLAAAGDAGAQQLSEHQLVNTLGQVAEAASAVDVAMLAQELAANPGKGIASLPHWSQLATLPQFFVEINFENNSVAIEPGSYRTLGLIADALHHPLLLRYKFLVVGHTNATGDAKHNLDLSARRAEAIAEALGTTFSVAPNRLFSIGVGSEMPVDPAHPKAADNRRVQLLNIGLVK
ncbi:MAG: OmpA family protein [Mesorhizobium sp.]|nr:MAG: OmpA family protein [Mesorhizobium sp.]TIM44073.1 MAG: OmpA family protein [Mesorhizobium sp.]